MQFFIKDVGGTIHTVVAEPHDTLGSFKKCIADSFHLDETSFTLGDGVRFLYGSDVPLSALQLESDQTLFLNLELLGGAKKRKKKSYAKPKKIKHKKKKNKLAILKCYKVDANNKVSRLRRECPNESCGAGVFMANHHDRTYCGRCSTSYMMTTLNDD